MCSKKVRNACTFSRFVQIDVFTDPPEVFFCRHFPLLSLRSLSLVSSTAAGGVQAWDHFSEISAPRQLGFVARFVVCSSSLVTRHPPICRQCTPIPLISNEEHRPGAVASYISVVTAVLPCSACLCWVVKGVSVVGKGMRSFVRVTPFFPAEKWSVSSCCVLGLELLRVLLERNQSNARIGIYTTSQSLHHDKLRR